MTIVFTIIHSIEKLFCLCRTAFFIVDFPELSGVQKNICITSYFKKSGYFLSGGEKCTVCLTFKKQTL